MKTRNLFASLSAGLLLCFIAALNPATAQDKVVPLMYRDGQAVDFSKKHTVDELKASMVLNNIQGLVISNIYHVRGSRPIGHVKLTDVKDQKAFDLYQWFMGNKIEGAAVSTSVQGSKIEPGDRFAFQAKWQGEPVSFSLGVL